MSGTDYRLRTALWRGVRRRCPQCGGGAVFKGWIKMHDNCSVCGVRFLRNQGDLTGYLVLVDRGVFIFPLIALIFIRLYFDYPRWFYWGVAIGLVGAFFYTMPVRNSLGLSLDYYVRRRWGDLSGEEKPAK